MSFLTQFFTYFNIVPKNLPHEKLFDRCFKAERLKLNAANKFQDPNLQLFSIGNVLQGVFVKYQGTPIGPFYPAELGPDSFNRKEIGVFRHKQLYVYEELQLISL